MTTLPLLTLMMVVPLVGAVVIAALPAASAALAKPIALGASLVTLVLACVGWAQWDAAGPQFQLTETYSWIPQFGVSYAVGVDGVALALIVMACVLAPVCILAAWNDLGEGAGEDPKRTKTYFALMLSLLPFMVGVFAATDVFLFYVFFEAMLIPVYFLIGLFGGPRRQYAAMKFILFSLAGGLIMLVGVIALYVHGPGGADGFLVEKLIGNVGGSVEAQRWMFLAFFIAFAIKAPMWPVHTWLPDASTEARPATAVLLVGVLDKVGTYGMIRFCLSLFPEASAWATPVITVLAVISVLYGALLAIGQTDMMRLIAYTSISHFGFIILGIFVMTSQGQSGSTLYMVNHGISTAALFLIAGFLVSRRGTRAIAAYGGVQKVAPILAGTFLVSGLATLSLPGLAPFISEFLVLIGTFTRYPGFAVCATVALVLSALYVLWMYQRMMTGPVKEGNEGVHDLVPRELLVVAPLIALLIGLGIYPKIALDVINPAVTATLTSIHQPDPAPAVAEVVIRR